jgi:hypothetical protein
MCNAHNHPPDCACGFGPPYSGALIPVHRESWLDAASRSELRFRQALDDLQLTDDVIEDDLRLYRDKVMSAAAAGDSSRARSQLANIVRRRRRKVEKTGTARVDIPLFKLHSPSVPGSKVTWQESTAETRAGSWSVTIFGIGMGADQTLTVIYEDKYSNYGGEYDLIYATVTMRWWLVSLYERGKKGASGKPISTTIEGEVDESVRRHPLGRGVRPCDELADDLNSVLEPPLATYDVRTPNPWTPGYEWEKATEFDVRFGIAQIGISAAARASVHPQHKVTLTFELPGGHAYELLRLAKAPGIVCRARALSGP